MKKSIRAAMHVAVLSLAGCATAPADYDREKAAAPDVEKTYLADKPEPAHRLYRQVLLQGDRNRVLNSGRASIAALELDADAAAGTAIDDSVRLVEAIYADNEKASLARSTFVKENYKDFKGEAYERAMVFYYRGILDLRAGDYENARAAFRTAMFQDTLAEDQRYSADTASLAYLAGWSAKCSGSDGLAREDFDEARKINPKLPLPAADDNVILIAEIGRAPVKYSIGRYNEYLAYERGIGFSEQGAAFEVGGRSVPAVLAEDIYFQASTRGGTQVAYVRESKAIFRHDTEQVAQVMTAIGGTTALAGAMSGNRNAAYVGLAVLAVGLIAEGVAAATTPQADIRYWDNLPDSIALTTLRVEVASEGADTAAARLRNEAAEAERAAAAAERRARQVRQPARREALLAEAEEANANAMGLRAAADRQAALEAEQAKKRGVAFSTTFLAQDGTPVQGLQKTGTIRLNGTCGVGWVRSRSALEVEDRAPNSSKESRSTARGPQARS